MYVLQLDAAERDYLLFLLKRRRTSTAADMRTQLRGSDKVFGLVMWSDADIASQLQEQGLPNTPENIRSVRESYSVRHIDDRMVEEGWAALEEGIWELMGRHESPADGDGSVSM